MRESIEEQVKDEGKDSIAKDYEDEQSENTENIEEPSKLSKTLSMIRNNELERVELSYCDITDQECQYLCNAIKISSSVKEINRQDNRISNIGAKELARATKGNFVLYKLLL